MAILGRANRRHFLRHPLQLLLAVLGVALGVAMVVSIDLATASSHRAFALSMEALAGRYTHHLSGVSAPLPEALFTQLRVDEGGRESAPAVEGYARAGGLTLRLVGFDPLAERNLRSRFVAAARAGDAVRLMTEPGAAMLSQVTARKLGVRPGGALEVMVNGLPGKLNVVAYAEGGGAPDPALEGVLLVDIATAQELLGRVGQLDRIDLVLTPEEAQRLRLPPGVKLESAGGREGETQRLTQAFELNLRAMSLLALLVGAFLIYNSMAFSVLQRRELLAMLRVLGATRGQLLREILVEAAGLGLVGGVLGVALGWLAAQSLLRFVTRTINDLYFVQTVTQFLPDPTALLRGLGLGVAVAVLAALGPAVGAAWASPLESRFRSGAENTAQRALPGLAVLGLAALACAGWLLQAEGGGLASAFAGIFIMLAGYGLLTPLLLQGLALIMARQPYGGHLARLAVRSVAASASRAGLAVAALSVAVAVGLGVGTMIQSFRSTVADWLDQILQADVYITAPATAHLSPPLPADLKGKLARVKGVERVGTGKRTFIPTSVGESELLALDPPYLGHPGFRFKDADSRVLWAGFPTMQAVFVSEPYAQKHGLKVGDRLELMTGAGQKALPVAGIFFDYRSERGLIVMHRALYELLWEDRLPTSIGLYLKPGAALASVRAEAERIVALERQPLLVDSNRDIRAASLATFDNTFAITQVLRLLAVGVAFVGVFSALLAFQHERRRELAVLRAVGLTPRQAGQLVLLQTGFMGLAAGLLSIPLGLVLALALVRVVYLRSFGWSLDLAVEPWPLLAAVALALAAALLAGLYPARRAMREQPVLGLREE